MKILVLSRGISYPRESIVEIGTERGHEVKSSPEGRYGELQISYNTGDFNISDATGTRLADYDYIIPRGPLNFHHIVQSVALYAQQNNIPMLNKESILNYPIFDKIIQHGLLASASVPIIQTVVDRHGGDFESLSSVLGAPFIYKYSRGAEGKHVYKIQSQADLESLPHRQTRANNRYYLAQKFQPAGMDYRVIVVGKKVIGAMKRIAGEGEFRANYSLGGDVEPAEVTPELQEIALNAAKACKCDYAGVDIMYWEEKPYVIEVNRFCHFEGFDKANNTKVADYIFDYIEGKN